MGDETGHTSPMISAIGSSLGCCKQCSNDHTNVCVRTKSMSLLYFTDDLRKTSMIRLFMFSSDYLLSFQSSFCFISVLFPPCILFFAPLASRFSYLFHSCYVFLLFLTFSLLFFIYLFSKYIFKHLNILRYLSSTMIPNIICR